MDNKNKKGVIYILTNPSFPKFVKIGYAHDLKKRLNQFNHESTTPYGFRAHAIYEVDRKLTDKKLHKLIDSLNPNLRAKDRIGGKCFMGRMGNLPSSQPGTRGNSWKHEELGLYPISSIY